MRIDGIDHRRLAIDGIAHRLLRRGSMGGQAAEAEAEARSEELSTRTPQRVTRTPGTRRAPMKHEDRIGTLGINNQPKGGLLTKTKAAFNDKRVHIKRRSGVTRFHEKVRLDMPFREIRAVMTQ
jgi:hypothetical protein